MEETICIAGQLLWSGGRGGGDGVGGKSWASQENGTEERGRMPSRVGVD